MEPELGIETTENSREETLGIWLPALRSSASRAEALGVLTRLEQNFLVVVSKEGETRLLSRQGLLEAPSSEAAADLFDLGLEIEVEGLVAQLLSDHDASDGEEEFVAEISVSLGEAAHGPGPISLDPGSICVCANGCRPRMSPPAVPGQLCPGGCGGRLTAF